MELSIARAMAILAIALGPSTWKTEAERENQSDASDTVLESGIARTNIVELEQWIVAIEKEVSVSETANHICPQLQKGPSTQTIPAEEGSAETAIFSLGQEVVSMTWLKPPTFETQLAFDFAWRQAEVAAILARMTPDEDQRGNL